MIELSFEVDSPIFISQVFVLHRKSLTQLLIPSDKGLFAGAKPGLVWADASTTDRNQTIELGKQAAEKGVVMLEGTMTGGMMALRNNKMVCLAGGDETHFKVS